MTTLEPGLTPDEDDKLGMAWWNNLTERERKRWSFLTGSTGRAKDAWEAFKDYQRSLSNGERE